MDCKQLLQNAKRSAYGLGLLFVSSLPIAVYAENVSRISCDFTNGQGQSRSVDFEFDSTEKRLYWIQKKNEFRLIRNTATELWGSLDTRLKRESYDLKDFRYNRRTGKGEFVHFRRLTPAELKICRQRHKIDCDSLLLLSELTQSGKCIEK